MAGPTHSLVLTDKSNKTRRTRVGVGWVNEKGWISLKINPGVTLRSEECLDRFYLSLYPIPNRADRPIPEDEDPPREFDETDIPF